MWTSDVCRSTATLEVCSQEALCSGPKIRTFGPNRQIEPGCPVPAVADGQAGMELYLRISKDTPQSILVL